MFVVVFLERLWMFLRSLGNLLCIIVVKLLLLLRIKLSGLLLGKKIVCLMY